MMEDKKSIFYYVSTVFATYGVIILIFVVLNMLIGEDAYGYSSLFEYGGKGLSVSSLIQLFVLSVIICVARNILFSDRWITNLSMLIRNTIFFGLITVVIVVFVLIFRWFPIDDIAAWIGFIVSFAVCSFLGVMISRIREKTENEKMNLALEKYKNEKQ